MTLWAKSRHLGDCEVRYNGFVLTWINPNNQSHRTLKSVADRVTFGVEDDMTIRRSLATVAVILAASTSASYASPCAEAIGRMQAKINAKLAAATAAGSSAAESTAATMHRQPTPRSIATAEVQLGDLSREQDEAVTAAMVRAREADRVGDQSACEQALSDAERGIR